MNFRKEFIILGLIAVAVVVIADGLLTPPGEHWFERMRNESLLVKDKTAVNSQNNSDEMIRRAAQAQWNLAEWYYSRGEWENAAKEYQRLIDEFPYIELDYGYRTDDARKRLLDVKKSMEEEQKNKSE
ncbi:MAG: hypothetical protein COS94_08735 [Candidatus Hydrogenedentes bacterium CG07_land_8_20_14_0_80_42_17]|nr:MAG: hypothetical protein COS94_08735 [Candidatus Hydrogenedentes bacterium CG07_land_8_20_14_0_80_42_17]